MAEKERAGSVRLLTEADMAEGVRNAFGKPLIGWKPGSQGHGSLVNPMGFAMFRVVVRKSVEGEEKDLYDQPMIVENPGCAVVCKAGNKVGLVRNFRMVGERLAVGNPSDYVRVLDAEGRWEELFRVLGAWRYELPQGLAPKSDDAHDLEAFVKKAAKLEAAEEGGFQVEDVRILGRVNANPTFFTAAQYVVEARIVGVGERHPEDLEILGGMELATPERLCELVRGGQLDNALSLAALAIAGVRF